MARRKEDRQPAGPKLAVFSSDSKWAQQDLLQARLAAGAASPADPQGRGTCDFHRAELSFHYRRPSARLLVCASFCGASSGRFKKPIVVEITKATPSCPAESYQQKFYKKNPARYHSYRRAQGRHAFLKELWGK